MTIEVKVPMLPESISDATVSTWHKKVGDPVSRDENLVDLETDKVMLEVPSPVDGVLKEIVTQTGGTVQAQAVIARIEEGAAATAQPKAAEKEQTAKKPSAPSAPATEPAPAPAAKAAPATVVTHVAELSALSPSARRAAAGQEMEAAKRASQPAAATTNNRSQTSENFVSDSERPEKRVPMTRMRARIAERLLEVTQTTAMLTTFNEINMAPVMEIRSRYREKFEKKYNVRLGFMSFFVVACVEALKRSPIVNASLDDNDIVYHGYYDIGVAVSTERGLVVPVLRDADQMSMAAIESKIVESAEKAKTGKLTLEEMQGGTFTITNGGVFGSLMSTPLLNTPQCAILGMHKIQERPVVENGQIVIRPMMYVALSYDHRLIDGKESVTFLVSVKELLEDPARLMLEV
ncbi:MAG TPA: 2-oxoglutarate dehydrogenase complex dihydrolipoyllysine-residue succinyltransferase [Gammaproteobacteria bacterium]|nr:2-oxoglutarate dehydrogenase complex dihydrolipoyllysine-residue succinyltransferase [Gammaproteobacteria bacterium]